MDAANRNGRVIETRVMAKTDSGEEPQLRARCVAQGFQTLIRDSDGTGQCDAVAVFDVRRACFYGKKSEHVCEIDVIFFVCSLSFFPVPSSSLVHWSNG